MTVDRLSKTFVLAWAVAVLLIEGYYVSGAWHPAALLTPAVLLIAAGATAWDRRAVAPILTASYLIPAVITLPNGRYHVTFSVVWLGALLGALLVDGVREGWHLPRAWRPALVCWVGGVCLTAPVVVLRTVDFRWELLFRGRLPTEALGGLPLLTVGWVLYVALLLAVGILWFDWLCSREPAFVARWVATPLALSALVLAAVSCYQMFVDWNFVNTTVYAHVKRASGTLQDANAAGTIAACWIGGLVMLGRTASTRWKVAAAAMVMLMWVAVWATGSRTALAMAAFVTLASIPPVNWGRGAARRGILSTSLALLLMLGGVAAMMWMPAAYNGPLSRFARMLPSHDLTGVRRMLLELWNRNGYGSAATRAIETYPLFGLGVGGFHEMASDFVPGGIAPDNAQNWYRHQLAELGVVGSLGWLAFLPLFGLALLRGQRREPRAARPLLGVLAAIAVISLVGMPGQDPFVAITLWTFAGWYLLAVGLPAEAHMPSLRLSRLAWAGVLAVVVIFTAGTVELAVGRLRVPARIQRAGGEYLYGFYWPEPDGRGGEYRWARREATGVVPIRTRAVEVTLRTNRADLSEHPVHVRASVNGRRVIEGELRPGQEALTATVMLPAGLRRMLIDTSADTSITAPPPDGRELAVMVSWRFLPTGEAMPSVTPAVTLQARPDPPGAIGAPVVWSAAAIGGDAPYTYEFWFFDGTSWFVTRSWSDASSWTWVPSEAGVYQVRTWVRNAGSTSRFDGYSNTRTFTIRP